MTERDVTGDEILQDRADRPVVRRGSTVLHPLQPWSPAVHALLDHLRDVDFPYSPRVLGTEAGTEILSYIEGESGPDGWAKVVDEDGLRAAARLLRAYHDAVATWEPATPPVWFNGDEGTGGPGEVVCHGDFGPWNIVWNGTEPVGLLDWEYTSPGPPRRDLAYALQYAVPFRDDEECLRWLRYPEPPDRRRRLEIFAEAYGLTSTDGLVDDVIEIQHLTWATVRSLAEQGFERQIALVADGEFERVQEFIGWIEDNRHLLE